MKRWGRRGMINESVRKKKRRAKARKWARKEGKMKTIHDFR
jgi:hypothetical protein